jgi:hypothetical protein
MAAGPAHRAPGSLLGSLGRRGCAAKALCTGPHKDKDIYFFRNMFEEPHNITTELTTSYEVAMLRPAQGSREATLSNGREMPPDVAIHNT